MVKEKMVEGSSKKKSSAEGLLALAKISEKYKNKKVPADLSVNNDYLYKLK